MKTFDPPSIPEPSKANSDFLKELIKALGIPDTADTIERLQKWQEATKKNSVHFGYGPGYQTGNWKPV